MASTSPQIEQSSSETGVLDVIRGLLAELGSSQAAGSLSLSSALERDLGLGSLERVELLVRLEKRFDRRLPDTLAQNAETPADWVRALSVGQAARRPRERYRVEQPAREASPAPDSARTWVEVLRHHAALEPDRVQIHLLEGDSGQDISYGKLLEKASRVAIALRARGLAPNQTVAIMLPTS